MTKRVLVPQTSVERPLTPEEIANILATAKISRTDVNGADEEIKVAPMPANDPNGLEKYLASMGVKVVSVGKIGEVTPQEAPVQHACAASPAPAAAEAEISRLESLLEATAHALQSLRTTLGLRDGQMGFQEVQEPATPDAPRIQRLGAGAQSLIDKFRSHK